MDVEYGLSGRFVDIDSYIVAVGMISFVHLLLNVLEHYIHSFTFVVGDVKVMMPRDVWG